MCFHTCSQQKVFTNLYVGGNWYCEAGEINVVLLYKGLCDYVICIFNIILYYNISVYVHNVFVKLFCYTN
jgi:hypothetical protein